MMMTTEGFPTISIPTQLDTDVSLLNRFAILLDNIETALDISMILVLVWTTIVVAGSERFGAILAHGIVPQLISMAIAVSI